MLVLMLMRSGGWSGMGGCGWGSRIDGVRADGQCVRRGMVQDELIGRLPACQYKSTKSRPLLAITLGR